MPDKWAKNFATFPELAWLHRAWQTGGNVRNGISHANNAAVTK